ncbi:hypothetical protein KKH42_04190, partial [bacterium]|nr:hypothetical protein [bacterium]
ADVRAATPSVAAEIVLGRKEELIKSVDNAVVRMKNSLNKKCAVMGDRLNAALRRPYLREPELFMSGFEQGFDIAFESLVAVKNRMFDSYTERSRALYERLNILSPINTLERGYAIAQKADGTVIKRARDAAAGDKINVRLFRGSIGAEVRETVDG